jgi:hypothetical protein
MPSQRQRLAKQPCQFGANCRESGNLRYLQPSGYGRISVRFPKSACWPRIKFDRYEGNALQNARPPHILFRTNCDHQGRKSMVVIVASLDEPFTLNGAGPNSPDFPRKERACFCIVLHWRVKRPFARTGKNVAISAISAGGRCRD